MNRQLLWKFAVIMLLWSSASCVCIGISWSALNPTPLPSNSNEEPGMIDTKKAVTEDIEINPDVSSCLNILSNGGASKMISSAVPSADSLKVGSPNEPSSRIGLGTVSRHWVRKIRCRETFVPDWTFCCRYVWWWQ